MRYKGKPPLVSFVVSVYNLERYIGSCLDSILSQPFYDYEIVLVNNNLSDGSDDICRRFRFAGKLYKFMGASNNLCRMQRREIFSADKASEGVVAVRRGRR